MHPAKLLIPLLLGTLSLTASAEEDGAVTPYRPSVSNSAQLPLAGQLELELGGLSAKTGNARRNSLPYLFKLAFNQEWGVLVGGEAYVSAREELGNVGRGIGDTSVVLKRAFLIDDATAYGLEFGTKLATAKETIGSGKADYTLNGIFSKDINTRLHMDANLNFTRIGAIDVDAARTQTGLSASFSTPIADRWSATAELSGTRRGGTPDTAQFLAAVTCNPSKRLAIDFGMVKGLTNATPDWSFFTGVVLPIARLW